MPEAHPFLVRTEHVEALTGIRGILERLESFATGDGERTEIGTLLSHLTEAFLVVVVGEVKSGKSSLINTLLRAEVCAVGPTPVTDRITILRHGEEETVEREPFVVDRFVESERLVGLAVVDTPGTNSIVRRHDEITRGFLPRADLVLFVTSCDRPYSESENVFLHLISEQWRRKIVFVLSKTDIREPAEVDEIREYVAQCARDELGIDPEILPVASKVADRAIAAGDDATLEASGLPGLEDFVLNRLDDAEKSKLRLFGLVDAALSVCRRLGDAIGDAGKLLEKDFRTLTDLDERTERRRRDLRDIVREDEGAVSRLFLTIRERGEEFINRQFRLRSALGAVRRGRTARKFRNEVVGDLDERLAGTVEDAVERLGEAETSFIDASLAYFKYRVEEAGARAPRMPEGFAGRRDEVIASVHRRATAHLDSFDVKANARRILTEGSRGVGLSAAGVGAGVLTATVATVFVNLWWSVVAIPFVAAGMAFLGVRRARACLEWRNRVDELSRRIRDAFGAELHHEIDRTVEEVRASYLPYLEFYQGEVDRMGEEARKLEGFVTDLQRVRDEVEESLSG
ncbi:MAG: dynamin family protein [Planctomycetota bacterium]